MQVAARTPQIAGDTAQDSRVESPSAFARANPKVVQTSEGSAGTLNEENEEETRAGLRRLAELIRDKRRSTDDLGTPNQPRSHPELKLVPKTSEEEKPSDELKEIRVETGSYHLIQFIFRWQERQRSREMDGKKTLADVILEEQHRRSAIARYQEALLRGPKTAQPEPLLPAALSY